MKLVRFGILAAGFLLSQSASTTTANAQTAPGKPLQNAVATKPVPPDFVPLQLWRDAVVSGDRAQIASYYATSPAARAKTPQGETTDPGEEPAFWSSLHSQTSGGLNLKILEVKTIQPGVMAFVLRLETKMHSDAGDKPAVVSFSQIWGQVNGGWKIVGTQRSDLFASGPRRLPQPAKPNTQLYPEPGEAPSEIVEAFAAAARDHKRVILIFGGNWCYDCHVLDATFRSKTIAPLVAGSYHVVHVNIGDYDKNLDIAQKYAVPLNKGVPSLAVLDPNGTLVFSQKSGEFENTGRLGPDDVIQFLQKWKANP